MHHKDTPVFYDQSGRRWSMTENIIVLLIALLGCALYWLIPEVLELRRPMSLSGNSSEPVAANASTPSVEELADNLATKNIAVIGSGSLVRVAKVDTLPGSTRLSDPFLGHDLGELNKKDARYVGSDEYAIQRYGDGEDRQLALTFDDGPDQLYTPQLLDLFSREAAAATFFVTGSSVIEFPDIVRRLISEGHAIGNHTFSHIDFNTVGAFRGVQEINQTQHLIAATTNQSTAFFRPPYGGNSDQSLRNSLRGIVTAQRLGYTVASYTFNSVDWQFPTGIEPTYPEFDGSNIVVLLHDGGGNRSSTISYVEELIQRAKDNGYSFVSLNAMYSQPDDATAASITPADQASLLAAQAVFIWPRSFTIWLFIFSLASLVIISLCNILLAIIHRITARKKPLIESFSPHVSIIVPAYNEDKVLESSVRSLLKTNYQNYTITIIDDGSSDDTWKLAHSLAKKHTKVSAYHQPNGGKAAALNNGIARSTSDIIICVDADTLFPPHTIPHLVRHFKDEAVAAVAGVVKVGNSKSILTKWQALEYISGISIERSAQALLGAITIVPGACGAWRRSVLMEVGGFSGSTLAEDCDLALTIQSTGRYKILQDNTAISYTEAPQSLLALTKQRFRWTFGNIQSLWKHRQMLFNAEYGWLGIYILPSIVLVIAVPIVFWPLLITLTIENIIAGNYRVILVFFTLSLIVQYIISMTGIALARERYSLLVAVPFARFIYGPIRMYILYKTLLTILKGVDVGWNKLTRTGTAHDPLGAKRQQIAHSEE